MSMTNTTTAARKSRRPQMSPEERTAQVQGIVDQLSAAVQTLTTSDQWIKMLKVYAQFHSYSINNVLLMLVQAEARGIALTRVAGYRKWISLGRQVRKGERGLKILAPRKYRLSIEEAVKIGPRAFDGQGKPKTMIRGFKVETVFDYSQTDGEPLPEAPELGHVTGDTDAWDALVAMVAEDGFTLTADEEEDSETRGHTDYTNRIVNIAPSFPLAERVHILAHELAHIRCDHEGREITRNQRETEAESVAFVVCTVLGLNAGDVAAVYVAGWSDGNAEVIRSAADAVHKAAKSILQGLEVDEDEEPAEDE